jgi:GTP cyclohydrolase I
MASKKQPRKEPSDPIQNLIRKILHELGENPSREGLRDTPKRAAQALRYLTSGYSMSTDRALNNALFTVTYDEMVIVKNIELFSLCEHHLLPFFGKCHVAYVPDKKVVGLSKIPRLVDMFARRLQIQERLTHQIAAAIQDKISPQGVGVVIDARHMCMMMRGVEKQHSQTVTSAMLGIFQSQQQTREEFLSLVLSPSRI